MADKGFVPIEVPFGNYQIPQNQDATFWSQDILKPNIANHRRNFIDKPNLVPDFQNYTKNAAEASTMFIDVQVLYENDALMYIPTPIKDMMDEISQDELFIGIPENNEEKAFFANNVNQYLPGEKLFTRVVQAGRQYGILKYRNPYTKGYLTVGSKGYFLLAQDPNISDEMRQKLYKIAYQYFKKLEGITGEPWDPATGLGNGQVAISATPADQNVNPTQQVSYSSKQAVKMLKQAISTNSKVTATSMRSLSFLLKNSVQRQAGVKGLTALTKSHPDRFTGDRAEAIRNADSYGTVIGALNNSEIAMYGAPYNKSTGTYGKVGRRFTQANKNADYALVHGHQSGFQKPNRTSSYKKPGLVCPGGEGLFYPTFSKKNIGLSARNRAEMDTSKKVFRPACAETDPSVYATNPDVIEPRYDSVYAKRFKNLGIKEPGNKEQAGQVLKGGKLGGATALYRAMFADDAEERRAAAREVQKNRQQQWKRRSRGPAALARLGLPDVMDEGGV